MTNRRNSVLSHFYHADYIPNSIGPCCGILFPCKCIGAENFTNLNFRGLRRSVVREVSGRRQLCVLGN